jgi:hypothetical protein
MTRVLMWEARGDVDGLIAWWRGRIRPGLGDGVEVELFRSADRVVALIRQRHDTELRLRVPDPPAELVARPPHAWGFDTVPVDGVPVDTAD